MAMMPTALRRNLQELLHLVDVITTLRHILDGDASYLDGRRNAPLLALPPVFFYQLLDGFFRLRGLFFGSCVICGAVFAAGAVGGAVFAAGAVGGAVFAAGAVFSFSGTCAVCAADDVCITGAVCAAGGSHEWLAAEDDVAAPAEVAADVHTLPNAIGSP